MLLTRDEGKTLEFKRDLGSPEGAVRTLAAFANTAGGILVVGVEDRTRRVIGVDHPLDVEERVASLISDRIEPRLVPEIEVLPWRRTHVVAVEVFPSPLRPHYIVRLGPESGVFVRVGSTNRVADPALIDELRRVVTNETFDEQAIADLDSEAVDFRVASEFFGDVRRLAPKDLETLRLLTRHGRRLVPSVGGLLLFGKPDERDQRFPDAWVQGGRFAGTDRARIIDQTELRGPLPAVVRHAMAFIDRNISRSVEIDGVRRAERRAVPLVALREAVINAVVHADYSQRGGPIRIAIFDDRIEVENPGLLPFGLTVDDLSHGVSRLRNRVIGRVFRELGLIEQWGSGIPRMTKVCQEAGLAAPRFEELATRFRVTLSAERGLAAQQDDLDQRLIDEITAGERLSTSTLAKAVGLSPRSVRTRLARLVDRGVIVEIGSGPNDPRRVYAIADR